VKFRARFPEDNGRTRDVEITDDPRTPYVSLDGEPVPFDVVQVGPGRYSLIGPDGRHAEASVKRELDGSLRVSVGQTTLRFELRDELTARALAASGRAGARGTGDLKAAIPGRVLRVLVSEGELVETGQTILVLEAMKMENEVRAPRTGRVRAIDVAAGQAVGAGDVLVRFAEE
jgi:biotin carboxyl carrier protein